MKEVEHLGSAIESNGATLLTDRQRRHLDRDKTVLAEGKAKIRMTCDFQKELSVVPRVDKLTLRGAAERDAAQYERAGIIGELLVAVGTLFSDNSDCFKMPQAELCAAEGGQDGPHGRKRGTAAPISPRMPSPRVKTGGVPKVFQKGISLR